MRERHERGRPSSLPRRRAVTALLAAALLSPAPASADKAAEATFYFELGMSYGKRGKVRQAVEAFFQSNRLAPNPTVTYNIAAGLEELRRYDQAFTYYGEVVALSTDEEMRAEAQAGLDRILPQVARLDVRSEPPGATIWLDRKNLGEFGRTPRLFAAKPGKRAVVLELPDHHPARAEVDVVKGQLAEIRLRLDRIRGTVSVKTEPPGATIRVGDAPPQPGLVTPADLSLPTGRHELHLTRAGHVPATTTVDVTATEPAQASATLEPLPPPTGSLTVLAYSVGALVELSGKQVGFTPTVLDDVVAGSHELRVSRPGDRPWSSTVDVAEGTPTWVNVTLAPEHQQTGRGPWPLALSVAAAGALATGAVLGGLALSAESDFEASPSEEGADRGESLGLAADVMLGVGVVVGLAAGSMFLFSEPVLERDSTGLVTGGTPQAEDRP